MAGTGSAHDGPHMARVIGDVLSAETEDRTVSVELRIEALEGTVSLQGVWAAEAVVVAWPDTTVFEAGKPRTVGTVLVFDGGVPPLFTLTLDFGESGLSPVLVVPRKAFVPARTAP